MIRQAIEQAVSGALESLGAGEAAFVVERPGQMEHGDYATNAALSAAKALKKNPREVADALAKDLQGKVNGVEKIDVAGAGFINFFLSRTAIAHEVEAAATQAEWGTNDLYKGKKVMVEYTDPNPFKEFHIGHLMSNAIGESIARVLESAGADVKRANYQGDVGPHVAKAIWGKMQKPELSWGLAYVYGNEQYEAKKEEVDAINKKVYERSDEQVNNLYDEGRKLSLEHFEELYKTLGTKFDHYFFESETWKKGLATVKAHPELFEESEGAIVFRGKHTRVFVNSQGLPTYEAKEMGLAEMKCEHPSDLYVYVTASEQSGYFDVVFEAIQKVFPDLVGKLTHRSHGMMRFAEGKMSSRKGNVITGESLLMDLKESAKEKMQGRELANTEEVAEQVAVGGIKYAVLKQGSGKDIIFDPEKSLSIEGDSGPYVQYAHTRALSLMREAEKQRIDPQTSDVPASAHALERLLLHFPDTLERAAKELEPHYVTTYITELASTFNGWYASERVIGGTNPHYGVLLATAVEKTLAKGLSALGIPAPEKM
ncbi:MAG: arginine--tRNA ligase [Candidatus Pacebacteria bacterium]|nr:arginine--tRNA ligase [Candidatus Paceibacterota bacterium]